MKFYAEEIYVAKTGSVSLTEFEVNQKLAHELYRDHFRKFDITRLKNGTVKVSKTVHAYTEAQYNHFISVLGILETSPTISQHNKTIISDLRKQLING